MQTYIAFLRGINVGGKNKIKMVDLKVHLEEKGFEQIETYIHSGNVIFKSAKGNCPAFAKAIKQKIMSVYGFEVPTVVLKVEDLSIMFNNYPFDEYVKEQSYFTILHSTPKAEVIKKVNTLGIKEEKFLITPNCVYLYASNGYGRAKGNNNFFEKKLQVTATTRNYKTIKKLLEMVS